MHGLMTILIFKRFSSLMSCFNNERVYSVDFFVSLCNDKITI